ncbi:MAG: hypothetical protein H7Z72_25225 [Bacteroidetes bacterium]|nr:hypothetical protein [Fibrella sp.]
MNSSATDRIRLQPKTGGASVVVAPAWGGRVCELIVPLDGINYSVIDGFRQDEAIDQDLRFKSAPLIPFPNRLKQGQYTFDGTSYQLPINEPRRGHAIHGLIYNRPMVVEDAQITDQTAQLRLTYSYRGEVAGYPFPFQLTITYSIGEPDGFRCTTTIKNTGSTHLPLGVGWHPYLSLAGGVADWTMTLPRCQVYTVDNLLIPTGTKREYQDFSKPTRLDQVQLNHCFGLMSAESRSEIPFGSPVGDWQLLLWMESGLNQYRYFQLFTPPDRTSIAVEPMSCCINAFTNHDGLIRLEPDETFRAAYGLQLRPFIPTT